MARRMKPEFERSPRFDTAVEHVTRLANRLAAGLTGEELSSKGRVDAPRAAVLASTMFYFLLRIDPADLQALFFDEGSLKEFPFVPQSRSAVIPRLPAEFL